MPQFYNFTALSKYQNGSSFIVDITSELVRVPLSTICLRDTKLGFDRNKLSAETQKIKSDFVNFLDELQQHLLTLQREDKLDISVIKTHLSMYDRQLKALIGKCESMKEIFETLSSPGRTSFLDYECIRLLVDYGNDAIKSSFIGYKKRLQKYLESCVIEQSSFDGSTSYSVVIDESITKEETNLDWLQNRVRAVLGHKSLNILMLDDVIGEVMSDCCEQKENCNNPSEFSEACQLKAHEENDSTSDETVPTKKSMSTLSISEEDNPAIESQLSEYQVHQEQVAQVLEKESDISQQGKDEVDLADEHCMFYTHIIQAIVYLKLIFSSYRFRSQ